MVSSGGRKQQSKAKGKSSSAKADLFDEVSAPRTVEWLGVHALLDCNLGAKLSEADTQFCTELLGDTMKMLHTSTGGARGSWDRKAFLSRMREPQSRVFMIRSTEMRKEEDDEWVLIGDDGGDAVVAMNETKPLGFLHVQLDTDRSPPALVVFEMQLVPEMRGKGLGKHVMEVVQMIAKQMGLGLVLYNSFKVNARALQQLHREDTSEVSAMPPLVQAH